MAGQVDGVKQCPWRDCRSRSGASNPDCAGCGGTGYRRKCDDRDCAEHGCGGYGKCYVSPGEASALSAQPSPGGQGDANSPLSVYADSYRRMAKMGDGRVSCIDVAFDIEHNMSRALAARQPVGQQPFAYTRATTAVVPSLPIITPDEYAGLRAQGHGKGFRALVFADAPPAQAVDLGQLWRLSDAWLEKEQDRATDKIYGSALWACAKELRDVLALIDGRAGVQA